tara:strand:+ start:440 stop:1477 length:1038 start_codon:yes stop_codon:yes gene_type:complete
MSSLSQDIYMRAMALLMITTILLVPLAGCVDGGDGPQFELSPEDIEGLIDANIDDFLNNTSITLNQNINYHNNSSVQQPNILKSNSGSMIGNEYSSAAGGGTTVLVRESAFPSADTDNSALGISGANICVGVGTTTEGNLIDWFNSLSINFTSIGTADAAEATDKLISGECDAFAGDSYSTLAAKKATLDTDGSIDGGTWIISRYNLSEGSPGTVGSAISIVIPQSSNEMITGIEYLFTQVTLFATCMGNDTSCEDIIQILSYDVLSTNMETSCSNDVLFSWSATTSINGQNPRFNGHGFDCTNTLNLHAINQIEGVDGYDSTSHELSWSDWAYSVIWLSKSIEN